MQLNDRFGPAKAAVRQALETIDDARVAVAVSGGSDSLALMVLLQEACAAQGVALRVVSVDHRLRPESGAELDKVAAICAARGLTHDRLEWREWDRQGNLQNEARKARYALMADWARRENLGAIFLGHTIDDQAETFLMRLARKAGSTGLSGMRARTWQGGVTWLRPLLATRRADLQAYLDAQGIDWINDPGNEDAAYERVKARRALEALSPLGIGPEVLAEVAQNLASEDRILRGLVRDFAERHVGQVHGALACDAAEFGALDPEIALRLLGAGVTWINGAAYPPRREALCRMREALLGARRHTLAGVIGLSRKGDIWLTREPATEPRDGTQLGAHWRVRGLKPGEDLRELGADGLAQLKDWRGLGLPREVLLTLPSVWSGERLVWTPVLAGGEGPRTPRAAEPIRASFTNSLADH
ncbi:tRNA lysidine(34) synthetase TilS [Rhodobacteraceae bacterium 63075]|nr:tRNA lysidine(34) synthetase TilS [Rhodobacteraceae bacterium 63075]